MAHGYSTRLHGDAYLELPTVALRDASCHGRLLRYHLPICPGNVLMSCHHIAHVKPQPPKTPEGCEECLKMGSGWVHLRLCLSCGHVGCCDSSPNRHATKHFHQTKHPVMTSLEPDERWAWCFVDEEAVDVPAAALPYLR